MSLKFWPPLSVRCASSSPVGLTACTKGETFIDDDGFDSTMVPIRATVTIQGDTMTVDLSESSPQVTGFINSSYANTRSLAHAAIMYMAPADVPKNEGSMRAVTIIAPKGLIVNPNPPAPVCMSTNHCGEEIIEAIFKALAPPCRCPRS